MEKIIEKNHIAFYFFVFVFAFFIVANIATASETEGTIDASGNNEKYAWGENIGWVNFGTTEGGVVVTDSGLSGYAWSENIGWISLNCVNDGSCETANFMVSNDSEGNLSGYAWSENAGWISFNCSNEDSCGVSDYTVSINNAGVFSGYAWSENAGWISFNCSNENSCDTSNYLVSTDWRPKSSRETQSSSQGSRASGRTIRPSPTDDSKDDGRVVDALIKLLRTNDSLFESEPIVTPFYDYRDDFDMDGGEGEDYDFDEKGEDEQGEEDVARKLSREYIKPQIREPIREPKISLIDRVGLVIRDRVIAVKGRVSKSVSGTGRFFKATGRSIAHLFTGKFNQIKIAFVETFKEDAYDPQQDPRISEELKNHSYEEVHIRLATKDGLPIAGASLTLFSEPRYAETDETGHAVFSDVPIGEHTLQIAFGTFRGEQALFLNDDSPKVLVVVTPNLQTGVNTWVYVFSLIFVAIFFVGGGYYLGNLRKSNRKRKQRKEFSTTQ